MSFVESMVAAAMVAGEAASAAGAGIAAGASAVGEGLAGLGAAAGEGLAGGASAAGEAAAVGGEGSAALGGVSASSVTPASIVNAPMLSGIADTGGLSSASLANAVTPTSLSNVEATVMPNVSQLGVSGSTALQNAIPASTEALSAVSPNIPWGQQVAQYLGADPGSAAARYGGNALEGAATSMGINGVLNLITGQPITKGMLTSGLAGGVGGAAAEGLAGMANETGMLGKVGKFAAEHPTLTAGGIGTIAAPIVSDLVSGGQSNTPTSPSVKSDMHYTPGYYHPYTPSQYAGGGDVHTQGGISDLGSYSDGGRLLKGPGDGVSDDIPAVIGGKQPARLAEGEFVVPARIVSELGNGSTDAGAKQLYAMMRRIQQGRHKTLGNNEEYAKDTHAYKHLPA